MKIYQIFKLLTTPSGEDWGYCPIDHFFTTLEKANKFVIDNDIKQYYIREIEEYGDITNEKIVNDLPRFWSEIYVSVISWYQGEQLIAEYKHWHSYLYIYDIPRFNFYRERQKDNWEMHCRWFPDECGRIVTKAIESILDGTYAGEVSLKGGSSYERTKKESYVVPSRYA